MSDDQAARLRHFEIMLTARRFEERLAALYRQGRIAGGVYLGKGQEAIAAALGLALQPPQDILAPLIRDMAARIGFGEPLVDAAKVYLGRRDTPMRGRDGNIHRGDLSYNLLPMISHLGAMGSVVNGMLMARRLRGEELGVGATSIGDGGMNTGAIHEALNQAAVEKLPLVLLAVDNGYAYSTPVKQSYACRDLADRAIGYGMTGHEVDARDFDACRSVVDAAVLAARNGDGPQLISAHCLRLCGHGEHDDATYIPPSERESARDCVVTAEAQLRHDVGDAQIDSMLENVTQAIDTAVQTALAADEPTATDESWQAYSDDKIQSQVNNSILPQPEVLT